MSVVYFGVLKLCRKPTVIVAEAKKQIDYLASMVCFHCITALWTDEAKKRCYILASMVLFMVKTVFSAYDAKERCDNLASQK